MSQGNPLQNLQGAGYSPYQLQQNQQLMQEESGFNGYQAQTAQGPDYSQLGHTQAQQQQLASSLQAQAAGAGPNASLAQLQQTSDANIKNQAALSAAAGASGGGGAGAARYNAANQAGAINQQAGAQAAGQEAQNQQAAQAAQAGVLGTMGGQNLAQTGQEQGLNLANTGAINEANQFSAQQAAQRAGLLQQNYQFGQGVQEQEQDQQNAAVAGLQGQQEQNQQSMINAGIGGVTGGLSTGLSFLAKGGVVDGPRKIVAGEAGREAEVSVPRSFLPSSHQPDVSGVPMMAQGGVVSGPDYSGRIAGLGNFVQQAIHGIRNRQAAPAQQPMESQDPAPEMQPPAATGRVLTHPTMLTAGEAGPEAIIPIKKNGAADMKRAKDPGVRQLISEHPEYKHPLDMKDQHAEITDRISELKEEILKLEKLHKSSKKKVA